MPKSKILNEELLPEEKAFCEAYFNHTSDTFGNGTKSAMKAYGIKNENSAGVKAYDLLRTGKIYTYGDKLLISQGFNDTAVDNQHAFLIEQSADLNIKAKGIDMYNKLKGRYEKDNSQKQPIVNIDISYIDEDDDTNTTED